ncbi:MAG TPA: hypothetical protein VF677_03710 [Flavobacterium sp.]|jgi:YD repeat-containing protein
MIKKHKLSHRVIATFFMLILFPTLVPNNVFAANHGPVAPEAVSFEPVDATDMVNLVTGDMSYVLPLLNIPSPEGGYPLTLSNHAGIAMNQEASWVGLGWSLNPGAINRGVTGVPDDWKRVKTYQAIYDQGGTSTTFSGSVSIGWGQNGASVGLYGSYTENKAFGGTTTYSTDGGVMASLGGVSASIGSDGASIGLGGNIGNVSASIGINQSFKNGSTGISASVDGRTPLKNMKPNYYGLKGGLGISFDSKSGLSASVVGQGFSLSGNNYGTGSLNMSTTSFSIPIQIYAVNVTLGYSRTRYWTYENSQTGHEGSLYGGDMESFENATNFSSTNTLDSYNSLYMEDTNRQNSEDNLSFIAYDTYSISGQGISGSFRPGIFENGSLINNAKINYQQRDPGSIHYRTGHGHKFTKTVDNNLNDIHFYFDNEPSSYLKVSSGNWIYGAIAPGIPPEGYSNPTSLNSLSYIDGEAKDGYNATMKRKKTGSYIETFTNTEINSSNSIIIHPENYNRSQAPTDGIGAFKITALDGKVYHYSLPVYQKEIFTKGTSSNSDFNSRFFEKQQFAPYATHWLLTAITGPDYVDANLNNKVDQADLGYWTSFDYGKWSDGYVWKSPETNDGTNKSYSWGIKEIYYLDKIQTRTHTALFIKEERQDDISSSFQIGTSENEMDWKNNVKRNIRIGKNGVSYYEGIYDDMTATFPEAYHILESRWGQYIKCNPHKSLKLNKILLLKNNDVNVGKNTGSNRASTFEGQIKLLTHLKETYHFTGNITQERYIEPGNNRKWYGEFFNNIYDTEDIRGRGLEEKAVKSIVFNYDYSLATNAPNSQAWSRGRLTLKSLQFVGRNNQQSVPPYRFEYENGFSNPYPYSAAGEDNWGYYELIPAAWSLNKIVTPLGSEIDITYEPDEFQQEAVSNNASWYRNGGGTRVQFIRIKENSIIKNTIRYSYHVPGFPNSRYDVGYRSSGITSYAPSKSFKEVKYLSELPSPGVMYEYVTVTNYDADRKIGVVQEYNFNVLKPDVATVPTSLTIPGILEIEKTQNVPWGGSSNGETFNLNFSKFNIKDMTASLGRLKQVKTFNSNGQLLSKTENSYQDISDIKQGITEETFSIYKQVLYESNLIYRLGSTSKIKYPNILKSTTSTQGGHTVTSFVDKLDFLTGQVVETKRVSSDGKSFKDKVIPAYVKYSGMGAKADNTANKNMLAQTAANYSYILDNGTWKETGVGITTWNNIWTYKNIDGGTETPENDNEKIWRMHKSYVWNGVKDANGIFTNYNAANGSDDGFNWAVGVGSQPAQWKLTSETTLYNHYSNILEVKDINGNYAATKMGDTETKTLASGNARYTELFYTGAENDPVNNWLEPEIRMINTTRNTARSHTGSYAVAVTSGSQFGPYMKSGEHRAGRYKVSVWSFRSDARPVMAVNSNTFPFTESYPAGDWVLNVGYANVPATDCTLYIASPNGSPVHVDDLMVRPVASSISGYVYNDKDELTYIIGNNGLATRFEYDAAGRLVKTYIEVIEDLPNAVPGGFKLSTEHQINYKLFN